MLMYISWGLDNIDAHATLQCDSCVRPYWTILIVAVLAVLGAAWQSQSHFNPKLTRVFRLSIVAPKDLSVIQDPSVIARH